ncbi:outer membrane protein assembly factor BamD [Alkalimarinus alittae]|uniref:Outer membrane protein assembly factor BamD n=1 Tax=Alkalimarinus alittae TaxID=2961619 RepID=A0ABY6N0I3_9ALTE|nr:outer membrane protein assembly factor BamD [Alkalimarinus alittae]UZE95594.1 outer membrane protein assembly factor BamD [Alkalimarinus alittae]
MRFLHRFTLTATLLLLGACASTPDPELTEKEYYDEAKAAIDAKNFSLATKNLEALETRYPFGRYAEQAQLDLIYARYNNINLEGARAAADRFIRLHPQSPHADYAYYIRGIASYNLDIGLASQYFPAVDVTSRDPGEMRRAFDDFSQLLTRYPNSNYAADAEQRMVEIRNRLSEYELHAARYYLKREAYIAAANRASHIVKNFPNTSAVEPALTIMVETYRLLGMSSQADDALDVLAANFPDSESFDKSMRFKPSEIQKQQRSLLGVVTFGLFE